MRTIYEYIRFGPYVHIWYLSYLSTVVCGLTLHSVTKRCGIRKVIIQVYAYAKMQTSERGGAAKNVIYHKLKDLQP